MIKSGKKLCKRLVAGILIFSMTLCSAATTHAYSANTQVLPAVTTSSEDYELVGIEGYYVTEAQKALDRINEIRLEACKEGVVDPNDSSKKLTLDDYIPMQWSAGLEMVARIRAAEASFVLSHTRPNGTSCFELSTNEVFYSYAENLAWNFSSSILPGIEQWYDEKADWVNQNTSAVTGHYTNMINPINNYVGLACMVTDYGSYPNTTCGRFGYSPSSLDTTMAAPLKDCIQLIEVQKEILSNVALTKISGKSENSFKVGDTLSYELTVGNNTSYSRALVMNDVKWTSSNEKIASVDKYGKVTGVGKGTVKIRAFSGSGFSAEKTLTVTAKANNYNSNGSSGNSNAPTVSKVKSFKAKTGAKKLTITWKKVSGASGYQLQVSTKSSFQGAKSVNIAKSKKKYVAKKLKAKKVYYVRIRAYKIYKDGNGKTKKACGKWVKVHKKTK